MAAAQDPELIRRDVERTREDLGATAEALAYKADVPSRTKEAVGEKVAGVKDAITGKVEGARDSVMGAKDTVGDKTPDRESLKRRGSAMKRTAEGNPFGLMAGAVAVGFLAGSLLPSTPVEQEKIGPIADDVKQSAGELAGEVKEAASSMAGEVQDAAKQAKDEIAEQVPAGS
jgi:hypothetical protein